MLEEITYFWNYSWWILLEIFLSETIIYVIGSRGQNPIPPRLQTILNLLLIIYYVVMLMRYKKNEMPHLKKK